jgi:hypothetical protein
VLATAPAGEVDDVDGGVGGGTAGVVPGAGTAGGDGWDVAPGGAPMGGATAGVTA